MFPGAIEPCVKEGQGNDDDCEPRRWRAMGNPPGDTRGLSDVAGDGGDLENAVSKPLWELLGAAF